MNELSRVGLRILNIAASARRARIAVKDIKETNALIARSQRRLKAIKYCQERESEAALGTERQQAQAIVRRLKKKLANLRARNSGALDHADNS